MGVVITFETCITKLPGVSYTHAEICPVVKNDVSVGLSVSDSVIVLLPRAPSLNDCSKLKGQCTDIKSVCITSVGPSLNPHSLS